MPPERQSETRESPLPPSGGSESPERGAPWDRRDTWSTAASAALAFLLRLLLMLLSPIVGADAYAYVMFARELREGYWDQGLKDGIHPGYPLAISGLEPLFGSYAAAGHAISILFSSLAILPYYALVRDIAGRRVALASSLLLACFPFHILVQADILSDGFFHFFFLCSVTLSWFGASRGRWTLYGLAGLAGGLAYLTRPEGVYTPVATLGVTALVMAAAMRRKTPVPFRLIAPALMSVVIFLCVAFPLVHRFREMTGHWVPSKRGSVETVLRALRGDGGSSPGIPPRLRKFILVSVIGGVVVLPATGLALWAGRRRFKVEGAAFWVCLAAVYSAPVLAAALGGYPVTRRHLLLPILFLLPFLPIAGIALAEPLTRSWTSRRRTIASSGVFALLLLALALRAVHPRRNDQLPIRDAALWVHQRSGPSTRVVSNTSKAMCYLEKRTVELPSASAALESLQLKDGDFALVLERHLSEENPQGLEILSRRFPRIARFPPEGGGPKVDVISVFAPGSPR